MRKRTDRKRIPKFKSEAEERDFWATHDTVPYLDWSRAVPVVFPNLKPSTETISLRLPVGLLSALKMLANKRDVPYQSLLKIYLAERVGEELSEGSYPNGPKSGGASFRVADRPGRRTAPATKGR
jgi:predicted DNA binding CopG/RHH family protein